MNPHYNNNEMQNDPLNDVEFESGAEDGQQLNGQGNLDGGVFNQGSTSIQDGVFEDEEGAQGIQNQMEYGEGVEND